MSPGPQSDDRPVSVTARLTRRRTALVLLAGSTAALVLALLAAGTTGPARPAAQVSRPAASQENDVVVRPPAWRQQAEVLAPSPAAPPPAVDVSYVLGGGIPEIALRAYQEAAAKADPRCGLSWAVLAAIGRVESNHGRYGGTRLYQDGSTWPLIRGVQLDGQGDVALLPDTDGGVLDGDNGFDRAIGPMQFVPSTWRTYASDGNGDGKADPDNIFDAAAAAAKYLCAAGGDLRDPAALRAAVLRYNHSDSYVDMVLSIAAAYGRGVTPLVTFAAGRTAPSVPIAASHTTVTTSAAPAPPAPPASMTDVTLTDPAPASSTATTTTITTAATTTTTSGTPTSSSTSTTSTTPSSSGTTSSTACPTPAPTPTSTTTDERRGDSTCAPGDTPTSPATLPQRE